MVNSRRELAITSFIVSNKNKWNNCFIKVSLISEGLDVWRLKPRGKVKLSKIPII